MVVILFFCDTERGNTRGITKCWGKGYRGDRPVLFRRGSGTLGTVRAFSLSSQADDRKTVVRVGTTPNLPGRRSRQSVSNNEKKVEAEVRTAWNDWVPNRDTHLTPTFRRACYATARQTHHQSNASVYSRNQSHPRRATRLRSCAR